MTRTKWQMRPIAGIFLAVFAIGLGSAYSQDTSNKTALPKKAAVKPPVIVPEDFEKDLKGTVRPDDDAAVKQVVDKLQGHWRVVSSQVGDEKALEAEFQKRRITFADDKLTYEYGNERQEKREGTIKLNPQTGAFDWTVPVERATSLAIYELKGDTLKIGFGNDGLVRPKIWAIDKDNVVWLLVLKREKNADAPPKFPQDSERPAAKNSLDEHPVAAEDKAVLAVMKLGGKITREDQAAGKPVVAVDFTKATTRANGRKEITDAGLKDLQDFKSLRSLMLGGSKVTDKGLNGLKHLKSLDALYLNNTEVTDAGLNELIGLGGLRTLDLTATAITDSGLKTLKGFSNLQQLTLGETKVTDAGLKEIKGLGNLQTLWLSNNQISDAGLKELKELKNLQRLRLDNTKVTGAGLVELAGLAALHHLGLSYAPVTDKGLTGLKELKSLQRLDLDHTRVTDAGLKELKDLKNLQTLSLSETRVTDVGLDDLKAIGGLRELYVGSTRFTEAGIKKLRTTLPELRIMR